MAFAQTFAFVSPSQALGLPFGKYAYKLRLFGVSFRRACVAKVGMRLAPCFTGGVTGRLGICLL
jgi:hypothetical protein